MFLTLLRKYWFVEWRRVQLADTVNLYSIDNSLLGLFWLSFQMLDRKWLFLLMLILSEGIALLTTWVMMKKSIVLILALPLFKKLTEWGFVCVSISFRQSIHVKWKTLILDWFNTTSYLQRKQTDISDFNSQIDKTAYSLINICQWAMRSAIKLLITICCCIYMLNEQKKLHFIVIYSGVAYVYYKFRLSNTQDALTKLRLYKKQIEKKISPLMPWMFSLFQNKIKTVSNIVDMEEPIFLVDATYSMGWVNITYEIGVFSELITFVTLYHISNDYKSAMSNRAVFGMLSYAFEEFGSMLNATANDIKNFDKLLDFIKNATIEPIITQNNAKYPIEVSVNIEFKTLHIQTDNILTIEQQSRILLSGESGCGKTATVNALQALTEGAFFNIGPPKNFSNNWAYMNQQMREKIPDSGITLRQLLEGDMDTDYICELIKLVRLNEKFNKHTIDNEYDKLSGGERMRLSILYSVWDFEKRNKQILILDEPEQGLDEKIRVTIIQNILEYVTKLSKPILIVYHGSELDLLEMSFTSVWNFKKSNALTTINEIDFDIFKKDIKNKIKEKVA